MHAKIVDYPSLLRDMDTQHIIQTDTSIVRKHEARVLQLRKEQEQQTQLDNLKTDMAEIKQLLKQLLNTGK
jgi:hypothetical protein